ncbi:hypothetical protein SAMN05216489_00395 [Streptomyces sp. 3213]|uniref:universal stress protein UspA n=1 Tax=Streptomyces sp. 3213.3 TaxID=1855348 RepID=UPI0008957D67|nr:universal stress protein UspA [Streptomyces sp. 3213.3]SEC30606.1 hypothetical protein SAMN05216489_00395 [Streptomyces sp. 3213] [Streptomyces sp. 3213.3]
MTVVIWIREGTWPACVDAARTPTPADADITLLHVTPADIQGAAHGAFAGLLGRGHPDRDPGTRLEHLAAAPPAQFLQTTADRLARPCTRTHLGPHSLGPASRLVVDHTPCPVLLVWPDPPGLTTMPPPPPHPPHHR